MTFHIAKQFSFAIDTQTSDSNSFWGQMVGSIHTLVKQAWITHNEQGGQPLSRTMGVFTWTRITFRKTFRNVIQNVIGIVIWTTCVLQTPFQSWSGTAHCEWYFAPTTQSARADWPMRLCMASARIFKMHTHESRSETALRLHGLESGFLGGSRSKTPFFSRFKTRSKSLIWNSFLFTWAKIRLSNQEKAESRFETSFGTWF